jgi:NTE family protein
MASNCEVFGKPRERNRKSLMSHRTIRQASWRVLLALSLGVFQHASAQSDPKASPSPDQAAAGASAQKVTGEKDSPKASPKNGQDDKSQSKPANAGEVAASTTRLKLGALDPSTPPKDIPHNRPVIGVAMGGGGALGLSEIGVLQWFEEHRIPVDEIAGTSMGSILAALYATGHTPEQMKQILTTESVTKIFRIEPAFAATSYRRREDSRDIPNGITVGLKHGPSLRNALLTDTGLNETLDREFLSYNDQTDFNNLPIPFRCQATDLNAAKTVTFSRGSLQDAVRASMSIPGVFRPFELDGHEFVDGAILENLPTADLKAMHADVILAISLPLEPVGKGDLDSILGVLQRAFAVGIENNEARDRKLANVVIMPDISGYSAADYVKARELSVKGYEAAEAHKAELLKYALNEADWNQYLAHRNAKVRGPAGTLILVKVKAPTPELTGIVQRSFAPLVNQPLDTDKVEALLTEIRADGRYDADYTVGYDSAGTDRPILLVSVNNKKTGPPFLKLGVNLAAQTGGVTRATLSNIVTYQDLGGYGSEFRAKIDVGFLTRIEGEYYRQLTRNGFFVAPDAGIAREPFYIYDGSFRASERELDLGSEGADIGWGDGHRQEVRAGWQFQQINWYTTTGSDNLPNYDANAQKARIRYVYDSQDRALVPRYGMRLVNDFGYLYATPGSPSAPQLSTAISFAHSMGGKNMVLMNAEGATMFNRDVAQPFRYTLGGPLRLSASAIDELRGTDYFLFTPGYLRRIASLPAPLGQSIYVGATYEAGQMRSPDGPTITRQDVYFGLIAETPLGIITFAPAIGNDNEHKFTFTIGKLF